MLCLYDSSLEQINLCIDYLEDAVKSEGYHITSGIE